MDAPQHEPHYENDRQVAMLTLALLGVAAIMTVALIIFAVLEA